MSHPPLDPHFRATHLRQLISDVAGETPRTMQGGVEQHGILRFLQRKLDEIQREALRVADEKQENDR